MAHPNVSTGIVADFKRVVNRPALTWCPPMCHRNMNTLCGSTFEQSAWLSVQVPLGTVIGYVVVHNRRDSAQYQQWLSPFEIFVGGRMHGDSGNSCGGPVRVPTGPGPFAVWCGEVSSSSGPFVVLRHVGQPRYLSLAELEVYAMPAIGPPPPWQPPLISPAVPSASSLSPPPLPSPPSLVCSAQSIADAAGSMRQCEVCLGCSGYCPSYCEI